VRRSFVVPKFRPNEGFLENFLLMLSLQSYTVSKFLVRAHLECVLIIRASKVGHDNSNIPFAKFVFLKYCIGLNKAKSDKIALKIQKRHFLERVHQGTRLNLKLIL
jgi:hypothetical protein